MHPNTQSCRQSSLESCYKREEKKKKKRAYEQRILDVEHGTFTPLMFSTSGIMGRLARTFYACLGHLLSIKQQTRYAATMGLIQYKINFSLMKAPIMCFWGARSSADHASRACDSVHLAVIEGQLTYWTTFLIRSTMHAINNLATYNVHVLCIYIQYVCMY